MVKFWQILVISMLTLGLVSGKISLCRSSNQDLNLNDETLNDTDKTREKMYLACDEIIRDQIMEVLAKENDTRLEPKHPYKSIEILKAEHVKEKVQEWFVDGAEMLGLPNREKCQIGFAHELSCNDQMIKDDFKERFNGLCEKSLAALNELNKDRLVHVPELYRCSETVGSQALAATCGILCLLVVVGIIVVIIILLRRGRKTKGKVQEKKAKHDEENPASLDEEDPTAMDEEAPNVMDEEAPAYKDEEATSALDEEAPFAMDEKEEKYN